MGELLAELIPYAAGLAITPAAIATGILLLSSARPVPNAAAFAGAFALVYALIAAAIVFATRATPDQLVAEETKAAMALTVGIVLLGLAAAGFLRGHAAPATHTPGWMTAIDRAGPRVAFGLGLALSILNPNIPILIAGVLVIAASGVPEGQEFVAAGVLIAASQLGLVGPILWFATHRASAERGLANVKAWLARHEHAVNEAVLLGFGALFAIKGFQGL